MKLILRPTHGMWYVLKRGSLTWVWSRGRYPSIDRHYRKEFIKLLEGRT